MELKVCIRTPKGKADATIEDWKIKSLQSALFKKANIKERYVNAKKDKMFWVIQCDAKRYIKIVKGIGMYSSIVSNVFNNKLVNKGIKKMADSPEDYDELRRLIEDGTEVEVVKEASAQEFVEANKTMWEKMKEIFVKTS